MIVSTRNWKAAQKQCGKWKDSEDLIPRSKPRKLNCGVRRLESPKRQCEFVPGHSRPKRSMTSRDLNEVKIPRHCEGNYQLTEKVALLLKTCLRAGETWALRKWQRKWNGEKGWLMRKVRRKQFRTDKWHRKNTATIKILQGIKNNTRRNFHTRKKEERRRKSCVIKGDKEKGHELAS